MKEKDEMHSSGQNGIGLGINCFYLSGATVSAGERGGNDVWNNLKLAVDMDLIYWRLRERKKAVSLHMRWLEDDDVKPGVLRGKKCASLLFLRVAVWKAVCCPVQSVQ
jgi:hypothetical protein